MKSSILAVSMLLTVAVSAESQETPKPIDAANSNNGRPPIAAGITTPTT